MEMEKEASATEACQKLHKLLEACQGGRVRSEKETGGGGRGLQVKMQRMLLVYLLRKCLCGCCYLS
jgi:hypothetical protein